jgi:glycosyltransferase involved in cell wall biosynthesis
LLAAVPDLKLVVLGEGTARAQLECSIRERGVAHRVRILGNRGDVGAIMRACDFLVVTSDTDGIPAAVIEAQHCGLPVVSFAVGGVAEAIDSDSGILVMAGDEAGLAAAVASLVLDRKRREALAAGARRNSVRFDIRSVAQRYLSFYRERIEAFGAS